MVEDGTLVGMLSLAEVIRLEEVLEGLADEDLDGRDGPPPGPTP